MTLETLIKQNIEKLDSQSKNIEIPSASMQNIKVVESFIKHHDEIYKNREKYDLHWAFYEAQQKMSGFFKIFFNACRVKMDYLKQKNPNLMKDFIHHIQVKRQKRITRKIKAYSIASFLVSFVDIILSLVLIILVSKVGHMGETLFSSALLGTLFFVLIAFLKVSLDRFYLVPKIHYWGWITYKKIYKNFRHNISMIIAIAIVLDKLSDQQDSEKMKEVLKQAKAFF